MGKHIALPQLHAYLDGELTPAEKREIWAHIQACARCYERLTTEENLRRDLKQGFNTLGMGSTPNFAALFTNVMTEARQPEAYHPNWSALLVGIGLTLIMLLPFLPKLNRADFAPAPNLVNVPVATETSSVSDRPTEDANQIEVTPVALGLNLGYASPAPPPNATAVASVEAPE